MLHAAHASRFHWGEEVVGGFLLQATGDQALDMIKAVNNPALKLHLDTFHMNIEEDFLGDAILQAGDHRDVEPLERPLADALAVTAEFRVDMSCLAFGSAAFAEGVLAASDLFIGQPNGGLGTQPAGGGHRLSGKTLIFVIDLLGVA